MLFSKNYFQMKCQQSLPVVDGLKLFSEYIFEVFGNHKKNDPTSLQNLSLWRFVLVNNVISHYKEPLFSSEIFMWRWSVSVIGDMSPLTQCNLMPQFPAYEGTLSLACEHPVSALSHKFSSWHTFLLALLHCSHWGTVNVTFPQSNCSKKFFKKKHTCFLAEQGCTTQNNFI